MELEINKEELRLNCVREAQNVLRYQPSTGVAIGGIIRQPFMTTQEVLDTAEEIYKFISK